MRYTLAGITAPPPPAASAGSNLEALDSTYIRGWREGRGQVERSILWVTLGPSSGLLGGR